MVVYWNAQEFLATASVDQKARQVGITTVDPQVGLYNYIFEVHCNLNELLSPVTITYHDALDRHGALEGVTGAASAWYSLHSMLHTGCSKVTGTVATSTKTSFQNRFSDEDTTWMTFWYGLLSHAFDQTDSSGNSVRVDVVQRALAHHDDIDSSLIGELSRALSADASPGVAMDAQQCYFGALAVFMRDTRGSKPSALNFKPGDALGLRLRVSGISAASGLLRIQHST